VQLNASLLGVLQSAGNGDCTPAFAEYLGKILDPTASEPRIASRAQGITGVGVQHGGKETVHGDTGPAGRERLVRAPAPRVGDQVISHWKAWQFFQSTVEAGPAKDPVLIEKLRQELPAQDRAVLNEGVIRVAFRDGDTSCRLQACCLVTQDRVPAKGELKVGDLVLFKQGAYVGQLEGDFFHLGTVTEIGGTADCPLYSGIHLKGSEHGKNTQRRSYQREWAGLRLADLRAATHIAAHREGTQLGHAFELNQAYTGEVDGGRACVW